MSAEARGIRRQPIEQAPKKHLKEKAGKPRRTGVCSVVVLHRPVTPRPERERGRRTPVPPRYPSSDPPPEEGCKGRSEASLDASEEAGKARRSGVRIV